MAVQRFISTSFWDDEWIQELNPQEKFLYLYLMTNPLTNIAGVYKITTRRMQFDTGLSAAEIKSILSVFEQAKKAYLREGYIILPNWTKHQRAGYTKDGKPNNIKVGIDSVLLELDQDFLKEIIGLGYSYKYLEELVGDLESLGDPSRPLETPKGSSTISRYTDADTDTNSDTDSNSSSRNSDESPGAEPEEIPESMKQASTLAHLLEDLHTAEDPKFQGKPDLWAKDIEKLIRLDKRGPDEVEQVLRWAKAPGSFWFPNIISGRKLREKYPALKAQMERDGPKQPKQKPENYYRRSAL